MNLSTDPWIPVVFTDGSSGMVSLGGAFERGQEIRDLQLRPHERIAVMRLLVCVAQAALDGPKDRADWSSSKVRLAAEAMRYLAEWKQAFELFGDVERFLQVPNLAASALDTGASGDDGEEGASVSKLDLALATGNNSTLFDHSGGSGRHFAPEHCALMLLTFQCFSPGGRIGVLSWDGCPTPGKGSSNHAPCLSGGMLVTLVRESSLVNTIHKTLLTKETAEQFMGPQRWGRPVWERMPQSAQDGDAVRNATETYLGRMAPICRAIRLMDEGRSLLLANGLSYPSFEDGWREPWATVVRRVVKKQDERRILRATLDRGLWREVSALTVRGTEVGGPAVLANLDTAATEFDLWAGGLVSDKAKPLGTVESVFHLPGEMLSAESQKIYEAGVRQAEVSEFHLRRAVSAYRREVAGYLDRGEMRDRREKVHSYACAHFWTEVEQKVSSLMAVTENTSLLGTDMNWGGTDWGRVIVRAARSAFDRACPHETPRQIRAYAIGQKILASRNGNPAQQKGPEEVAA